jgi:hypothetical protein
MNWNLEEFFKRNITRVKSDKIHSGVGRIQIEHNGKKIHFHTHGLNDVFRFMDDYYRTMRKILPENKKEIYKPPVKDSFQEKIKEVEF